MKVILTLGIVLGLLVNFAYAEVATPEPPEQNEKNIEVCTENLLVIGKAIQAYQKEHGDFPAWLSDLHPKHLTDENVLICPSDKESGKPIFTQHRGLLLKMAR